MVQSRTFIVAEIGAAIHVHKATPAAQAAQPSPSLERWAPACALVAVLAAILMPRATPWLLLLMGAPIVVSAMGPHRASALRPLPNLTIGLGVLCIYLALNAMWAVDPLQGVGRAVLFAVIAALVTAVWAALPKRDGEHMKLLQRAVLIGAGVGVLFLAVETVFDQPVRRLVVSAVPFLRPAPKHMTVTDGWVTHIGLYTLNRSLAMIVLLLWPLLLIARAKLTSGQSRLAAVALLGATAIAVFFSEHETSMLALVAGCLVFAGMTVAPKPMRALVLAAWVAATLLVVPLAATAYDKGLHQAGWLPQTARNRIVLWGVTADKVWANPVLGIGIDSTKPLDEDAAAQATVKPGDSYPQRTGRHAHNIFMQTWYELGAVGALLLLAVGVLALRALGRLPAADQPYAVASFVSAMAIGAFTWGMWQPWFMAAFGIWAAMLVIGLDAASRTSRADVEG